MHIALAVKRYSHLVLLGILATLPISSEAQAEESNADTTSAGVDDPFGGEDPFALIENRQEVTAPGRDMPPQRGRRKVPCRRAAGGSRRRESSCSSRDSTQASIMRPALIQTTGFSTWNPP